LAAKGGLVSRPGLRPADDGAAETQGPPPLVRTNLPLPILTAAVAVKQEVSHNPTPGRLALASTFKFFKVPHFQSTLLHILSHARLCYAPQFSIFPPKFLVNHNSRISPRNSKYSLETRVFGEIFPRSELFLLS